LAIGVWAFVFSFQQASSAFNSAQVLQALCFKKFPYSIAGRADKIIIERLKKLGLI